MAEDRNTGHPSPECREFEAHIASYLEGEEKCRIPAHAKLCSSCGALLADLESIRSAAANWPFESPSPRVWGNIRATLAEEGSFRERKGSWLRGSALRWLWASPVPAAALGLLVVLAVFLFSPGDLQRKMKTESAPTLVAATAAPASLTTVEANLARTVQQMEENYKAREALLDPSAKRTYNEGLTSLDSSIRECLSSLREHPNNNLVHQYLMRAYSEKADVLASALEYDGR